MLSFSIIVPSYNQGEFLEETILSVLKQNYPQIELIIIDGGSTDNSLNIIHKYEKQITYWISEKDSGQSNAINKGFKIATGDIVNWLNSDDLLEENALNKIKEEFLRNPNITLVHGKTILFNTNVANTASYSIAGIGSKSDPLLALSKVVFPQPSAFFKRKIIAEIGVLDETLHYGMDYDMYVRIIGNYQIKGIDDVLSLYRLHSESKTTTSTPGFYQDWRFTFSKLLRSIPDTKICIEHMKSLGQYHESTTNFEITKLFSDSEIVKMYCYHISNGLNHQYEDLQLKYVRRVLNFIQKESPEIYKEINMRNIHLKAKYLPAALLSLLRALFRKENSI